MQITEAEYASEDEVNKRLNDKKRVAAALEMISAQNGGAVVRPCRAKDWLTTSQPAHVPIHGIVMCPSFSEACPKGSGLVLGLYKF